MQRVVHSSLHLLRERFAAIPTIDIYTYICLIPTDKAAAVQTKPSAAHFRIVPGFSLALELHSNGAEVKRGRLKHVISYIILYIFELLGDF